MKHTKKKMKISKILERMLIKYSYISFPFFFIFIFIFFRLLPYIHIAVLFAKRWDLNFSAGVTSWIVLGYGRCFLLLEKIWYQIRINLKN
jgi:hypothetical protein